MSRRYVSTPTYGDVAYVDSGSGLDSLFIHGVFLNADLWGHQIADLSDLRHCLAVDLLAHGESPCPSGHLSMGVQAAMVVEFLDALGIERIDLVGNDTGGAVAQILAATHPERVRSLTLTNSDTDENFPPEAFLPVHALASQGVLAAGMPALAADPTAIRTALGTSLEHPESIPDATLLGFLAPFTKADRAEALQTCIASMEASEMIGIRDGLARFTEPTLIVWGTDDVFFPVKWAGWLEATIPGVVRSVRVEGARLFFPLERPTELNRELRRFWAAPPGQEVDADPSLRAGRDASVGEPGR
jgi:pimeloyl-ACP methyl ester carboxylesterase